MSQSSHPATIAVAGIFVLLVAYILVDPIVSREVFTEEPKRLFPALALIGLVAAGLAVSLLLKSGVPRHEAIVAAVLFGVAMGAAGYPTSLHLNRLFDPNGLKTYEYRVIVQEPVVFEPLAPGLPRIDYFALSPYWERFTPDMRIPVKVRNGGLGFWQFDIDEIVGDIRRFQAGEPPLLGQVPAEKAPDEAQNPPV